ncbi:HNH endonuclease [Vibrio phage K165]|nr:hypothetical protein NVP1248O_47 [Vibrio phage 1.248.O._10N.261.54.F1]
MKLSDSVKECKKCETVKHKSEFYPNSRNRDGLQGACSDCMNKSKVNAAKERRESQKLKVDGIIPRGDTGIISDAEKAIKYLVVSVESLALMADKNPFDLSSMEFAAKVLSDIKKTRSK